MFRLVSDADLVREAVHRAVGDRAEVREVHFTPVFKFMAFEGLPTTTVAFTTDVPALNPSWGQPFLIGPGSIHVAHTAEERIAKQQLRDAVEIYARLVRRLLVLPVVTTGQLP